MNAVVPLRSDEDAPLVRLSTGGVAAVVRLDEIDARNRVVWYVVRLAGAKSEVRGRVVAALRDGKHVELGRLEVAPGSIGESRFAVPQLRRGHYAHLYLDLAATDLALRVEAPSPPAARRPRTVLAAAFFALAAVVAGGGAAVALAVPRSPIIVAPLHAVAGDVLRVAYATRGVGRARYVATTEDGAPIGGDELPASRGEIGVTLPASVVNRRVDVLVEVEGPLGRASRDVVVSIVPPVSTVAAVPSPARIAVFTARRERDIVGESVLASYLAVADGGTIVLSDDKGKVVGRSPFTRAGTSRIIVAPGSENEALMARLDVRRSGTRAFTIVTLPPAVAPAPQVALPKMRHGDQQPSANQAPISATDLPEAVMPASDGPAAANNDDPFAVIGQAIAGRPMTVAIRHMLPAMHLRLEDDAGGVLAETAVPPGVSRVALTPPAATTSGTYYLTCSYGGGIAKEVIVRSVRVSPP